MINLATILDSIDYIQLGFNRFSYRLRSVFLL